LLYLERTVGGLDVWLPYARDYVRTFKGKVASTATWKAHLFGYFEKHDKAVRAKLDKVDWEAWLHGRGLDLPVQVDYDTNFADAAYALAKRWNDARDAAHLHFGPPDIASFTSNQIVVFLETLETSPVFAPRLVHALNKAYSLDGTSNQEIRLRWYAVALKAGEFAGEAAGWVKDKGRMKFARPTYKALFRIDRELARKTFRENAAFYHPICRAMIAKDLKLDDY